MRFERMGLVFDYPDDWTNYLPQIGQMITMGQQGDDKALITGL